MKPETTKARFTGTKRLGVLASAVFFALLASCNYSEIKQTAATTPSGPAVNDLDWLMTNLFHQSCVSCHNGGRQPGGFKFETAGDLMSQSRTGGIAPGSSATSQIYQAIVTGRMPPGNNKPSAAAIEVLRCWIDAGAAQDSTQCAPSDADANPSRPSVGNGGEGNGGGNSGGGNGGGNDDDRCDKRDDDDDDDDDCRDHGDGNGGGDDSGGDNGGGDNGGGDDGSNGPSVSFAQVAPILEANCIRCHGAGRGAAGVRLHTFESVTQPATGPQLVSCGNGEASLLYQIVLDDTMPMGGEPLTSEQKQTIFTWIAGGCAP